MFQSVLSKDFKIFKHYSVFLLSKARPFRINYDSFMQFSVIFFRLETPFLRESVKSIFCLFEFALCLKETFDKSCQ